MKKEKYRIDLERHHLEKIKAIYTVFKFSQERKDIDFSKKLISFEDFVIALAPLMETYHKSLDRSSDFRYNTQLALNRLMHLYELIQFPLIEGFDYHSTFLNEFRDKTAMIDGNEVKIWEDLDSKIKEGWIERWYMVKNKGYDAFFLDEDIGYSNFYKFRYLPIEEDFKLFLMGKAPTNEDLFLDERKRDKFWQWFLSTYLWENVYPLM